MICFCSCTGVSASTLEISRKQAATACCKTCGGKPLVNGRGSSSISMPGAVGLELTGFINSDLTWTKITKGSRSSSRRARKSLPRSLKSIAELVNKDPKAVDMPVSESEKLGVSVLGCRFSEKAEHVPIKKRRFLFRSPSPPPAVPSPSSEKTGLLLKFKNDLHQEFRTESLAKSQPGAIKAAASTNDLGQIVDSNPHIDVKNLVRKNDRLDEAEDFSGISILAAAACSNCSGGDDGHAEEGSGMEESFVHEVAFEGSMNNESCSLLKGISKEDRSSAENSKGGAGSCISVMPSEVAASSRTANSSNCLSHKNTTEGSYTQDLSMTTSKDLSSKKDEGTVRPQESSSRDDRLHWDLNTVMDAWGQPFEQCSDSQNNVAVGISDYGNSIYSDRMGSSEDCELHKKIETIKGNAEKETLSSYSRDMVHKTQQSSVEEHKLDACTDTDRSVCLQKGLLSSEINYAPSLDSVQGTKSFQSQEGINPNSGSVDLVLADNALGPQTSANVDRNASAQCGTSGSTGSNESSSMHQPGISEICSEFTRPRSNHGTSTCVSEGNSNAASVGVNSVKRVDDYTAGVQTGEVISPSTQVEKHEIALPPIAFGSKATCENGDVADEDAEGAEGASFLDNGIAPTNIVGLETSQPQEFGPYDNVVKNSACKLDEVGPQTSHMCIEMPTSGVLVRGQPAVVVGMATQQGKVSVQDNAASGSQMLLLDGEEPKPLEKCVALFHSPSRDACPGSSDELVNISDKVAPEEPLGNNYGSDICHDEGHLVGIEDVSELEMDYDSQYEDGEVRESIVHAWEDYHGEDVESEHVDYGSDNTITLGFEGDQMIKNTQESSFQPHPSGSLLTEVIAAGSGMESAFRGLLTGKDANNMVGTSDNDDNKSGVGTGNVTRNNEIDARGDDARKVIQSASLNMKMTAWDQLLECQQNPSDIETGVRDGINWEKTDGDSVAELDAEDTEARIAESGVFKRDLRSRIEGRASRNILFGKDKVSVQGSRYSDTDDSNLSNPRFERESGSFQSFGRGRYSRQNHTRGRGGDRWVDSSENHRGFKRHHSPSYHGPMTLRHLGSENSAYRSFRRSGSPVGRDEVFGVRVGVGPTREMSPYRTLGRGRSIRYGSQVDGRGTRGRYQGPPRGNFRESSFNHSHPSARRDRSFSPTERRVNTHAHPSCTKSPSRSRTRSPICGTSGFRHRSKSPNFRSEAGMQSLRSPHQRPGFLADHMVGFRPMRRVRDSPPPHDPRWIGDRRDEVGHFREHGYNQRTSVLDKRLPGRFATRDDRFDLMDAPRSYRSLHPGRMSEMDGVGRGSLRYDDRRKDVYKYRSSNLVTRNDIDGPIKRFRYDVEDGFVAARNSRYQDGADFNGRWEPKDYNRGIDSRVGDVARRSGVGGPYEFQRDGKYDVKSNSSAMREVGGPYEFQRDGKYDVKSNSSAMREVEEDSSPRKRPS